VKKAILAAAALAAIGLPSIASAQTVPASASAPGSIICHVPKAGETSNATIQSAQLVCRPVNVARVRAAMKVMMGQKMSTDQMKQMQAAADSINDELGIPAIPGGAGSNPSGGD
jgi:hypothetical protein